VPPYGLLDASYEKQLREAGEASGALYMLSLTKFRSDSGQILGRSSSRDPDSRYVPIPLLSAVSASLCFVADVVAGSEDFHRVGVIRYPTKHAFVELHDRSDTKEFMARKERRAERLIMLGMSPTGGPPVDRSQLALLEVWLGPSPEPIAAGTVTEFEVEGTYIGDGRHWSGARYTSIEPGTALPLEPARFGYLAALVTPIIERWI
jgi:hypothetical protein